MTLGKHNLPFTSPCWPGPIPCMSCTCRVMCTEMICSVTFPGTEVREETGERRVEQCSGAAVLVTAADASQRGGGALSGGCQSRGSAAALWPRPSIAQRTLAAGGSDQQSSSSEEEDEEEDEEEEEEEDSDLDETRDVDRVWADSTQWPAPHAASKCQLVEELVDDLLRACRGKTCHSFVPRLQPAIGVACVCEGWSAQEDNVIYRLLVPMRAPPGHAFRVELGNPKETPKSKKSCLRVELECMCARERLLGDMLCFLHHTRRELRENQEASLLNTLCRASYLDVRKTTRWFQNRVKAAWNCLPQSRDWGLELVPSDHSCKIKLTPPSKSTFTIEMTLGVQLDESGTFLSFD
ncbi:inositol 1,4,5-trisphosphate receptor-interacting protein-like 1 isoform X2 [Gallus gallus]|uniref:inositol 1,4,5-trisphosphate receptor-interacting protein-like 1 isoform X2 n=1 Tax=Gallus gallus TaxID=9031 RepID=UPI001F005A31|nr:inositol 1,4,5-trisphosphate receptor-interacting protein-like 1 isoform X2 [Gallus gallus]